ncbi:unnamed protein product [Microthlaspi erraticum]|uniref:Uncharacterized protein n=1 Tax=Microthlaspi erraticum TaxID=1685480 RepID=A0A6D2K7N6_9BRAS|nr:unnamed protein product [Microthlaspi erraticum]
MNPSVVAAHKRIGLLQRFNKWQGKAMEKMQKSMDKMVSKIKSLEKKVSGSQARRSPRLPLSLGVGHSSPPKEGSPHKSLTEPLLSSQRRRGQHAEKEEDVQGQTLQLDHRTRSSPNRGNSTRSS